MTKEELNSKLVSRSIELDFAQENGHRLFINVDPINMRVTWNVKWLDKDGLEHFEDFTEFSEARDYFLERIDIYDK